MRFFFSSPATMRSIAAVKSVEVDAVGAAPRREQRGFVDQVGEVGAGEAGGQRGDLLDLDVVGQHGLLEMHLEDVDAAALVRPVDQDLAIEAAGAQQRRIEDLRPVGRRQQNQPGARIEAVELHQELVERLFLLVVAAHRKRAARPPERVELVDEDDRRRRLARLFEEVAHPRGADADEHLDEFRPRDREELDARLAGDGARQQRLARPGRPDQQNAFGDSRARAGRIASACAGIRRPP